MTMRLDRWFTDPVEELWRYLTEAALLDRWLVHGRVDAVRGGRVEMTVATEPGNAFDGAVAEVRAPVLLEHTLGGDTSVVRWELHRYGTGTRMELRQTGDGDMAWPAAGWHVLLDAMEAALAGRERAWTWDELAGHRAALGAPDEELDVIDAAITIARPRAQVFAAMIIPSFVDRPTRIVELAIDRTLAHGWSEGSGPDRLARWRLADVAGGTRVRFAHRGSHDGGRWRTALENLKRATERG